MAKIPRNTDIWNMYGGASGFFGKAIQPLPKSPAIEALKASLKTHCDYSEQWDYLTAVHIQTVDEMETGRDDYWDEVTVNESEKWPEVNVKGRKA